MLYFLLLVVIILLVIILHLSKQMNKNIMEMIACIEKNDYLAFSKADIEGTKSYTYHCEKELRDNYGKWLDGNFNEENINNELSNGKSIEDILQEIRGLAQKDYNRIRSIDHCKFKIQANIDVRNGKRSISEALEEDNKVFEWIVATYDQKQSNHIKEFEEYVREWCAYKGNI